LRRIRERRATDRSPGGRLHISTPSELRAYVVKTTLLCTLAALSLDIVNQLVFFEGWSVALRSWGVTVAISSLIAAPVTRAIGKANLELFRAKEIVEKLSRTDPLTGLLNRRALLEPTSLDTAVMALVIVDIDRFKRVNDTHGHMAGDEVIRVVARLIQTALEDFGRVGRLGGEEFALVSDSLDVVGLARRLDTLRNTIQATPIMFSGQPVFVTVSAGWALRRSDQGFADLYAEADRALYLAKDRGRNAVVAA
jgi:diguanylate cyclase (GGDEF)-like protein